MVIDKKNLMDTSGDKPLSGMTSHSGGQVPLSQSSGSTATVCIIRNGAELAVAHVGDSRALLCRKASALQLTEDHEPESDTERERIERCKGRITWSSVGRPRVNGVLEMTRSIGDMDLKKCGVTAEPDVHVLEVSTMLHAVQTVHMNCCNFLASCVKHKLVYDPHTHTQPFYSSLDFVRDNPSELVASTSFHLLDLYDQPVNPAWFYLPGFYLSGTCSPG